MNERKDLDLYQEYWEKDSTLKERKKLGVYQKVLLFLMVVTSLVFMVFYLINYSKEWYEYKDTLLLCRKEGDNTVLSGEIEGEKTVITMTEDKTIEIKYGEKVYGPYVVKRDETADSESNHYFGELTGIVIYCGEEIRFRGGIKEYDGSWIFSGEINEQDNIVDPMEPSVKELFLLWEGPKLIKNVLLEALFVGIFICIINAISIIYADEIFKWGLRFVIRSVDKAEPSDWEIASRYIGWTLLFICAVVMFYIGVS